MDPKKKGKVIQGFGNVITDTNYMGMLPKYNKITELHQNKNTLKKMNNNIEEVPEKHYHG